MLETTSKISAKYWSGDFIINRETNGKESHKTDPKIYTHKIHRARDSLIFFFLSWSQTQWQRERESEIQSENKKYEQHLSV